MDRQAIMENVRINADGAIEYETILDIWKSWTPKEKKLILSLIEGHIQTNEDKKEIIDWDGVWRDFEKWTKGHPSIFADK